MNAPTRLMYALAPWVMLIGWSYSSVWTVLAGLTIAGLSGWIRGGRTPVDDL